MQREYIINANVRANEAAVRLRDLKTLGGGHPELTKREEENTVADN